MRSVQNKALKSQKQNDDKSRIQTDIIFNDIPVYETINKIISSLEVYYMAQRQGEIVSKA